MVKRAAWLSVTPEPERELPLAVATMRAGGQPFAADVDAERETIERLLLRGTQRRWIVYLRSVTALISACEGSEDAEVARQRHRAIQVLANHHNLLLGLPGPGARLTTADRDRLSHALAEDRAQSPPLNTTIRARTA